MDKKHLFSSVGILVVMNLTSCASVLNKSPDQEPPRLISGEKQEQYGWTGRNREYVLWDRPGAFGTIPENLRATGDRLCMVGGFSRAVGYHPKAIGVNGQPIPGGGYLCTGYRLKKNTN